MSKFEKISNYTIEYENFLKIVQEFDGYLLGLTNNNLLLFMDDIDKSLQEAYRVAATKNREKDFNYLFRNILAPKIFDRTTGTYFTKNLATESSLRNVGLNDKIDDYLHIVFSQKGFASTTEISGPDTLDFKVKPEGFSSSLIRYKKGDSPEKYGIDKCFPYINKTQIIRKNKTNTEGKDITDSNGNPVTEIVDFSKPENESVKYLDDINNLDFPDRFNKPNLTGYVVRDHGIGVLARQKNHLPIFFGAIPPIELSRCTPYIDVKIISTDLSNSKVQPIDLVSFMRFTRNEKGEFVSEDGIGLMGAADEAIKNSQNSETTNISYMDIFNSPQTLSNANINKLNVGGTSNNLVNSIINQDHSVYEPIMPFMTLKSFNVSITSAGTGLFASKSGNLKIVLHDRSRLKDIAPLVATDRFATTKIQIEFGWNHPDGGINSDNIIGQYLDSLKDIHLYQVLGSDYSFSGGNSVDIGIKLVAHGYREASNVHCGAGPYVPLNTLSDIITQAASQASQNVNNEADLLEFFAGSKEVVPEVRQNIKVNSRSARQLTSVITWSQWQTIASKLKNKNELLTYITEFLKYQSEQDSEILTNAIGNISSSQDFSALQSAVDVDQNKENLISAVFGKLLGLQGDDNDPFVYSLHKASKDFSGVDGSTKDGPQRLKDLKKLSLDGQGERFVTLGKLLLNYIGLPMASSCLYDEVQMVFYPFNHQAGGARKHTTASLPINLSIIEKHLIDRMNKNSNLSVKGFFNLIEREILSDRNLPVYGFSELQSFKTLNELKDNKTEDEKLFHGLMLLNDMPEGVDASDQELNQYYAQNNQNGSITSSLIQGSLNKDEQKTALEDLNLPDNIKKKIRKLYDDYVAYTANQVRSEISEKCKQMYEDDGLGDDGILSEAKFVKPNVTLLFETNPAIADQRDESGGIVETVQAALGIASKSDGLSDKSILRIHVYDEEAIASPAELTLINALVSGTGGKRILGSSPDFPSKKIIDKMSFYDAKEFVKRSYPTIIYGSAASTIKSLSVSANTSGELANVLMVESYGDFKNPQDGNNHDTLFEEVTVFPNSVDCTIMGMPMITRGTSLFIDFGTNTSLDSIYTVKSVDHTISSGEFSTRLELVPSNMGAVSSFRDKIGDIQTKTSIS